MTEKITYIAKDGKEFKFKENCLKYEAELANQQELIDTCQMYDYNGERIDTLENASELFIPTQAAAEAIYYKYCNYMSLPWDDIDAVESGHWEFDYDEDRWVTSRKWGCPHCNSRKFEVLLNQCITWTPIVKEVTCLECGTKYNVMIGPLDDR